jgi:RNA polymerase sigma-70 factor (ECF subfamily)
MPRRRGTARRPEAAMEPVQLEQLEARVQALLARGDAAAAATAVIEALTPAIFRYLRPILRDDDDADDALSIWAERVWRGLPAIRSGGSLRPWAYRIARHVALNLRDEAWRRRGRRLATGEASRLAASVRMSSVNRVERQADALASLRRELSPEDQELLSLRVDQGLSWKELAEVLSEAGDPVLPNALMKRFERLRDRLGALARERGLIV